jgi:hypothetical protein
MSIAADSPHGHSHGEASAAAAPASKAIAASFPKGGVLAASSMLGSPSMAALRDPCERYADSTNGVRIVQIGIDAIGL